ncbi:MAG: DUF72 domain-containing protein [Candidatus Geothermarchaeales archaeon]
MARIYVGTGGWAYFDIPGRDALREYARHYDFVEVDSTFYHMPREDQVLSWRRRVPRDFEFAVKANRRLTHVLGLEPVPEALDLFEEHKVICSLLESDILVLQTPTSMELTSKKIERIRKFFSAVAPFEFRLAWEIRRPEGKPIPSGLIALMEKFDVLHSADLSVSTPKYLSDLIYSRLFGPGRHNVYQFADEELAMIVERAEEQGISRSYLSFHGIKMYKDAARLKVFMETASFPMATGRVGLESLREALKEDATFPASKQVLLSEQGWKVIDLSVNRRVKASVLLEKLPSKSYKNVQDVMKSLTHAAATEEEVPWNSL